MLMRGNVREVIGDSMTNDIKIAHNGKGNVQNIVSQEQIFFLTYIFCQLLFRVI